MADIIIGGTLKPNSQNTPTRKGEVINTLAEITEIENPVVGMSVFVKSSGLAYRVMSLKEKAIAGVTVPNAMVDKYEKIPSIGDVVDLNIRIEGNTKSITEHGESIEEINENLHNHYTNILDLTVQIGTEEERAKGAEQTLQNSLNAEIARAKEAERSIEQWIDGSNAEFTADIENLINDVSALQNKTNEVDRDLGLYKIEAGYKIDELEGQFADSIHDITEEVRDEITRAKDAETKIVDDIKDGNTIAGLSREVYSLQGKEDKGSFLVRTTAGGTSVDSGVARLRQVGGNVVKNLVDGTFASGWRISNATYEVNNMIAKIIPVNTGVMRFAGTPSTSNKAEIKDHIYYQACYIRCEQDAMAQVFFGNMNSGAVVQSTAFAKILNATWAQYSIRYKSTASSDVVSFCIGDKREVKSVIYAKNPLFIDLTEMFGAGKEPTKEECDAMFAGVGALPKGISVAKPTAFKSVGYNQCDVSKAIASKTITDGTITDGNHYLVPMPCVPCKLGTGENNGYIISTGEGDAWSEEPITAVYYTPLNPTEVTGELYLQELEPLSCVHCNGAHNVYVPECAGWLLIETASIDKLCAHFAWSGDRDYRDYEDYTESNIALPAIPEMSEWGLAGVLGYNDTIDLENKTYTRKVRKIVLDGTQDWVKDSNGNGFYASKILSSHPAIVHMAIVDAEVPLKVQTDVTVVGAIRVNKTAIYINYNAATNAMSAVEFKTFLANNPITIYYALQAEEEYHIKERIAPAYLMSDYGTEEFEGSQVPLNGNILFYQRSLVNETRNFLDRLFAGLGTTDVKTAADMIISAVKPVETINEEIEE